jgi:hypothetical protein
MTVADYVTANRTEFGHDGAFAMRDQLVRS